MARITSHFDISSSSVLRDRLRGGRLSHSKIVIGSGYLSRKGQRLRYRSKLKTHVNAALQRRNR